jgi:hypothetical protein
MFYETRPLQFTTEEDWKREAGKERKGSDIGKEMQRKGSTQNERY